MHILLTSSAVEIGGSEVYLRELAFRLLAAGHVVTLFVPGALEGAFSNEFCGTLCVIDGLEWSYSQEDSDGGVGYMAKLNRQSIAFDEARAEHGPFDLVFINANWPTHYAGILHSLASSRALFVVHFHLCPHTVWLNREAVEIHSAALRKAAGLSTISRTAKLFLEQTFGRLLQIQVIENGSRFSPGEREIDDLARRKRENVIACVGRLDHQKGHLTIAPALASSEIFHPYRVRLLGDGPLRGELTSLLQDGGSAEMLGNVSNVMEVLGTSEGFLLPSFFEGMALSLLEALALGAIPIVSDASSTWEVVEDGVTGFVFETGNWRSLALAVGRFRACDHVEVRRNCLDHAKRFTRDRMLGRMLGSLEATFGEGHPAGSISR